MAITRLTADGSPDTTFHGDGLRRDALNGWACSNDAALDASGKLLVAVQTAAGMAVVRYTNIGARDSSFNANGVWNFSQGKYLTQMSLAPTSDGGTYVTWYRSTQPGPGTSYRVARLDAAGELVPSFGTDGIATFDVHTFDRPVGLVTDNAGGAVLLGRSYNADGTGRAATIVHFDGSGSPVLWQSISLSGTDATLPLGIDVDAAGRIVAGFTFASSIAAVRLTPTGAYDPTYGDLNGAAVFAACEISGCVPGHSVLTPAGMVFVGRATYGDGLASQASWAMRLTPEGQLDPSFSGDPNADSVTGSKVTWDLYPGKETLNRPAVSPDGALVPKWWLLRKCSRTACPRGEGASGRARLGRASARDPPRW